MPTPFHCVDCFSFSMGQRRAKILIADSDWPERSALTHALEARGYTVLAAKDGRQAVELIRAKAPDLSLIDICLSDFEEFGVIEALRAVGSKTQMVAICTLADPLAPARIAAMGARDFLKRPLVLPMVEAAIDAMVDTRMARHLASCPAAKTAPEAAAPVAPTPPPAPAPLPEPAAPEIPPRPVVRAPQKAGGRSNFLDPLDLLILELRQMPAAE